MVFQIQAGEPGILPRELLLAHEGFQQPLFRDPIQLADKWCAIPPEALQSVMPFTENPIGIGIAPSANPACCVPVLLLNSQAGDRPSILQPHGRFEIGIARQLLDGGHRLLQLYQRSCAPLEQIEHQPGGPDFERRGVLAEVGVTDNQMQPPILCPVRMGLVARIENGPVVHRVHTQLRFHKIRPLRELKGARHKAGLLGFHTHLPCAGDHLAADQERQEPLHQLRERQCPWNEVVIVAAITVTVKVGIIFVELNMRPAQPLIATICRALHNALPRPVMRQEIFERPAFRGRILRVRVVVVKPRAVRQDQIALHLMERIRTMGIDLGEVVFFLVLLQTRDTEAARILMRIFAMVIPPPFELAGQMGPHQLHGFLDRIDRVEILPGDAVLCFNAEEMHSPLRVRRTAFPPIK